MASASEVQLGELHGAVAAALTEQVQGYTETVLNKAGDEVSIQVKPSPALLGAAISFLKNNNITADPSGNAEMATLKDALQKRRSKRLSAADLDIAAEQFARSVEAPGSLQ